MKPTSSLALLEKSVSLPGASVSRTRLMIDDRATDKQLGELGAALVQIDGSRSWWLGDYGLFLQNRKRAEILKADSSLDPADVEAKGLHFMSEKAGVLGIDDGSWKNCVMVCRFFKPSFRHDSLSFGHHVVAMMGGGGALGDPKKAIKWLVKAHENGWSVSQFRENINKANATATTPDAPPPENPFEVLDEADKWAHQATTDTINSEAARALLVRWAELLSFMERLKELAK